MGWEDLLDQNMANPFLFLHLENPMDQEYTIDDGLCDAECQTGV